MIKLKCIKKQLFCEFICLYLINIEWTLVLFFSINVEKKCSYFGPARNKIWVLSLHSKDLQVENL